MEFSEEDMAKASEWIKYWSDIFDSNPVATEGTESILCPPEPAPDEQAAAADPGFLAECRADVVAMSGGPVIWEDQLVTRSPRWGLVWRADFRDPKISDQLYPLRVACWKNDAGELGTTFSGLQHDKLMLKG